MKKTVVLKVFLIGTRRYAYRLSFRRAKVPEWIITAINLIVPRAMLRSGSDLEDPREATENAEEDWEEMYRMITENYK